MEKKKELVGSNQSKNVKEENYNERERLLIVIAGGAGGIPLACSERRLLDILCERVILLE